MQTIEIRINFDKIFWIKPLGALERISDFSKFSMRKLNEKNLTDAYRHFKIAHGSGPEHNSLRLLYFNLDCICIRQRYT